MTRRRYVALGDFLTDAAKTPRRGTHRGWATLPAWVTVEPGGERYHVPQPDTAEWHRA